MRQKPSKPFVHSRARLLFLSILPLLLPSLVSPTLADDSPASHPTSASADLQITSKDGSLALHLPAGWKQTQPINPDIILKALADNVAVCVSGGKKLDFVSLDAYAKEGLKLYVDAFKTPNQQPPPPSRSTAKMRSATTSPTTTAPTAGGPS